MGSTYSESILSIYRGNTLVAVRFTIYTVLSFWTLFTEQSTVLYRVVNYEFKLYDF